MGVEDWAALTMLAAVVIAWLVLLIGLDGDHR